MCTGKTLESNHNSELDHVAPGTLLTPETDCPSNARHRFVCFSL